MLGPSIQYQPCIASNGFRWLIEDPPGVWALWNEMEDWPEYEYLQETWKSRSINDILSQRVFLSAVVNSDVERSGRHDTIKPSVPRSCPVDLYLSFVSERPTPQRIVKFANEYGLLCGLPDPCISYNWGPSAKLSTLDQLTPGVPAKFLFFGEKAYWWIRLYEQHRRLIQLQGRLAKATLEDINRAVSAFFYPADLKYRLVVDRRTRRISGDFVAPTLRSVLQTQLGMSIAANITHRQCAECPRWFAVHASRGRPQKTYCSNACRTRACRRRKTV